MNKTLAQLKTDLAIGTAVTMIYSNRSDDSERIAKLINIPRYVVKKNTVGICFNADKTAKTGSHLDYPKASLLEYTDNVFTVYDAGYRPLTASEQAIRDNVPSSRPENAEKIRNEIMSDGNGSHYLDLSYYRTHDAEYLMGHEEVRGLKYDYNTQTVRDNTIKGEKLMEYTITI